MTATIKYDTTDGQSGREILKNGNLFRELSRTVIVDGLTGNGAAKINAAYDALSTANVVIYSAHPEEPNLFLLERNPEVVGPNTVRVRLQYRQLSGIAPPSTSNATNAINTSNSHVSIEGGASCIQISVNRAYISVNGANTTNSEVPIYVSWTDPADEEVHEQGGFVPAMQPQLTKAFTRTENTEPLNTARSFVGKINVGPWSGDPAASNGEWLCTGITWRSDDGGLTYGVNYGFQYRNGGWAEWCVYSDPATGRPPASVTTANGMTLCFPYNTANFETLGLP